MRWSSAQRHRTSNAEPIYAPFFLVPLDPILAGFSCGAGGFYDARNISTARPRPGTGTYRETPDLLSHDPGRCSLHLFQSSPAARRANALAVPRASFVIP